jgi:hypothetical protein
MWNEVLGWVNTHITPEVLKKPCDYFIFEIADEKADVFLYDSLFSEKIEEELKELRETCNFAIKRLSEGYFVW